MTTMTSGAAQAASRNDDPRPNVANLNDQRGKAESPFLKLLRAKDASFLRRPNPERPTWGVTGLIPHGSATLWATEPGFAKSTELRRLAAKVAWWMPGATWMNSPITEPKSGRVLVICAEDPAAITDATFLDVEAVRMMDEWQVAHPDRRAEDNLKVVYQDEGGSLFETQRNKVVRTKIGDDVYTFVQEWQPDLVIFDTLTALLDIEHEMSVGQATAAIAAIGRMIPSTSMGVLAHHFIKVSETKNLKEALHQTRGSGGYQSRARHILNGYEAYTPLDDLVRENGWGGADHPDAKVVCFGVSKTNIPGAPCGKVRVYVRQPMQGTTLREMVEITDDVLAHPNGP